MQIWAVEFFNTTDGRCVEQTEHFATKALAREAAKDWKYMGGAPATRIYPISVKSKE